MTLQKRATILASLVAFLLTVVKLVVGVLSGSVVVLASAIDSILDMVISLFNLYAVRTSEKKTDDVYNYGRGKIEGFASLLEGLLITVSGFYIIYKAVDQYLSGEVIVHMNYAIGVMLVSIAATGGLVLYLNHAAKKTGSLVVKADALHYKSDLYTNLGIIVSLGIIFLTGLQWIDSAVSIAIALYIIAQAFSIMKEGYFMLMDRALDDEEVKAIEDVIRSHPEVNSYHYLRTRQSGTIKMVDVHLVFNDKMLLKEAHAVADDVEMEIRKIDDNVSWMLNVHMDPYDDRHSKTEIL